MRRRSLHVMAKSRAGGAARLAVALPLIVAIACGGDSGEGTSPFDAGGDEESSPLGGGREDQSIEDRREADPEAFELDRTAAAMEEEGILDPDDPETASLIDEIRDNMEVIVVEACDDASADEDYTGAARDIRMVIQSYIRALNGDISSALGGDVGDMLRGVCPEVAEDILDEL